MDSVGLKNTIEDIMAEQPTGDRPEPADRKPLFRQLEALFHSSFDGIWICNDKGIILQLNPASERINGLRAEDWIGRDVRELAVEGYIDRPVTIEVIKQKRSVTIVQHSLRSGKRLLVTGSPILDPDGEVEMVVTNDRDITELDDLRLRLIESEARMERFQSELIKRDLKTEAIGEFICRSSAMKKLLATSLQVAGFQTNVLLTGASGTGKSLFAKLIHQNSKRKDEAFIRVECGSIPASLFESEIFGYEKGAFTGADQQGKMGLFEMADGGTLFLDEIDHTPYDLQHKLLRFLETGNLIRVGSTRSINVNVRVIAASNVDLEPKVKDGSFRGDLLFRLKVVPINLPSLKERSEDIPFLIKHFLEKLNKRFQTNKMISVPAIEALTGYQWPGNVRELENLIERLVVMSIDQVIDRSALPESLMKDNQLVPVQIEGLSLREAVRDFEARLINLAVEKYGSQVKAAEVLNVSPATIARKRNRD